MLRFCQATFQRPCKNLHPVRGGGGDVRAEIKLKPGKQARVKREAVLYPQIMGLEFQPREVCSSSTWQLSWDLRRRGRV